MCDHSQGCYGRRQQSAVPQHTHITCSTTRTKRWRCRAGVPHRTTRISIFDEASGQQNISCLGPFLASLPSLEPSKTLIYSKIGLPCCRKLWRKACTVLRNKYWVNEYPFSKLKSIEVSVCGTILRPFLILVYLQCICCLHPSQNKSFSNMIAKRSRDRVLTNEKRRRMDSHAYFSNKFEPMSNGNNLASSFEVSTSFQTSITARRKPNHLTRSLERPLSAGQYWPTNSLSCRRLNRAALIPSSRIPF